METLVLKRVDVLMKRPTWRWRGCSHGNVSAASWSSHTSSREGTVEIGSSEKSVRVADINL